LARRSIIRSDPNSRAAGTLWICSLVLGWYTVSITLILYNKWVITSWTPGGMRFPISYTTSHMLLKGCLAWLYFSFVRGKRPPWLGWGIFIGFSLAGSFAALDIVTSNLSFLYISATFYTFLKSASLTFMLGFALLFCLEPPSASLISTVALTSAGMFLASYGAPDFHLLGFCLVMASEVFAALRWVVTQIMMKDDNADCMTAVLYMSPAATLTLLPWACMQERDELAAVTESAKVSAQTLALVLFPGFLSFILLLVEVQLVKDTSSLTLSVFGHLKSVATIAFSLVVFHEKSSLLQWVGLLVALCGMVLYAQARGEWNYKAETCSSSSKDGSSPHADESTGLVGPRGMQRTFTDLRI